MKVELRHASADDIDAIAADARPADVAEVAALGQTVAEAMRASLECSDWAATGFVDDVPVLMLGVSVGNVFAGEGVPWMLTANGVLRAQKSLLKTCAPVIAAMHASYPRLANVVSDRNTIAKRWLRWLGFTLDAPSPYGPFREPFCRFWSEQ